MERMGTPIQRVRKHFLELVNVRRTWEPTWRDVRDLVVPARGRSLDGIENVAEANSGIRHDKRINGTTSRALKVRSSDVKSRAFPTGLSTEGQSRARMIGKTMSGGDICA